MHLKLLGKLLGTFTPLCKKKIQLNLFVQVIKKYQCQIDKYKSVPKI